MKPGPKPKLLSAKKAAATYRASRDPGLFEINGGADLPAKPDWLTTAGEEVWLDDLGRVGAGKLVTDRDSTSFAIYCNLVGAITLAWRAGDVPPAAHLAEARRMAEQFGVYGAKSRLVAAGDGGKTNPFTANGRPPSRAMP